MKPRAKDKRRKEQNGAPRRRARAQTHPAQLPLSSLMMPSVISACAQLDHRLQVLHLLGFMLQPRKPCRPSSSVRECVGLARRTGSSPLRRSPAMPDPSHNLKSAHKTSCSRSAMLRENLARPAPSRDRDRSIFLSFVFLLTDTIYSACCFATAMRHRCPGEIVATSTLPYSNWV